MNNYTNWYKVSIEETYRLSQAEFKGMTIQALQDIRNDIAEIKRDKEIKGYINYFISGIIGLFAGMISGSLKR